MTPPRLVCLLIAVVAVGWGAAPASALRLRPCRGQPGFGCATLRVPLDRTGRLPGAVRLRIAVQDTAAARRRSRVLVALSGGPGQGGVAAARSFAASLRPALSRYRLVVLDQRGTGASGALSRPAVQRRRALAAVPPSVYASCAVRLGAPRAAYATADSVADLEALRGALGVPRLALMGVSYGTYVAQQYARTHPTRTERLILDSVVPAAGVDPFLLDSYAPLPRVLREQCARSLCRGITADPVADLGALVARLRGTGSVRGRVYDARGRASTAGLGAGDQLFYGLLAGDLNPYLQAALPMAIRSALLGDAQPLARLVAPAEGPPTPVTDLSAALNLITGCADAALPYPTDGPRSGRPGALTDALAAIAPGRYAPFDLATVRATSYGQDCSELPPTPFTKPSAAPLPDVPTLVLSGRLDLRTPLENGVALIAGLPRAARVTVPGTGHDELDSDLTGCARRALARFVADRRVGHPCLGLSNAVAPLPLPPRGLSAYRPVRGIPGVRGRAVAAVADSLVDAQVAQATRLLAGLSPQGGGLRGGSFGTDGAALRVRRYAYLPGLRLTGAVRVVHGFGTGTIRVEGPRAVSGVLRFGGGRVRGTLGGRAVATRRRASAAIARAGGRWPRALPLTRRSRTALR